MPSDQLNITIVQPDLVWEDRDANLKRIENLLDGRALQNNVVILPEMFSTGFSMHPESLAERMDGTTVRWMGEMAEKHRCIFTGSLIIDEEGKYFNRLIWMQPDRRYGSYDKRHLFAYAGEDAHYDKGDKRLIVSVNGWKVCLLICYDLRFPVWSRNLDEAYDLLVYVANWPEKRSLAWRTLLQARAIENQSYVAGINRVGTDGKGLSYRGESSVFGPLGEQIWQAGDTEEVHQTNLELHRLTAVRKDLPFLKDADRFLLMPEEE